MAPTRLFEWLKSLRVGLRVIRTTTGDGRPGRPIGLEFVFRSHPDSVRRGVTEAHADSYQQTPKKNNETERI
jgi:hypothetical protein